MTRTRRALLALLLGWPLAGPAATALTTAVDDGVYLACEQPQAKWLECDYRLIDPLPAQGVSLSIGELPVVPTTSTAYPYEGGTTLILFLVDTSDPRREPVIEQNIRHITRMLEAARPYHVFGLSSFDSELRMEAPPGSTLKQVLTAARGLKAVGKTTELYRNVLQGVRLLARQPADRRAIFLLSDGLVEDYAYRHEDVVAAARAGGVAIYGLGYPRSVALSVALQTLRRLAEETGGRFVKADEHNELPETFLAAPFASLDNGGHLAIDLTETGLHGPQELHLALATDRGPREVSLRFELPAAEPATPRVVEPAPAPAPARRPPPRPLPVGPGPDYLGYLLGALGLALLGVLAYWLARRYRGGASGEEEPDSPYAYLEFPRDPKRPKLPLVHSALRIGRHPDNDLQFDDPSVSRHHAEIHRQRDGSFTVTDLDSLNGVYVNERQVKNTGLSEGDSLEIGDLKLRFTLYPGKGPSEDETEVNVDKTLVGKTREPMVSGGFG